jgi:hypothetical protein
VLGRGNLLSARVGAAAVIRRRGALFAFFTF